ncbi:MULTISPECIES: type II secretion system F family protein [unclassified Janthinobacterium]|uniref:type II secretion system F family protein n=1 Tax=unclassified Janthinobacterium TaxID=2610881 RepID=UPI0016136283|nr:MULTISPECIES: type II secretion system F family protein [unclassified Janthinobacterium]MBB5609753.1 general secretion pathway protein F [Janthinobacterium sp. S3T4]MBB5614925.1 general secretion pathway protein F [Janthinobacterium sp. S3M3]
MQFDVRVLSADMAVSSLIIDGRDEADARQQAEARGLFVSAIAPLRGTPFNSVKRRQGKSLSLVLFSQELLALLTAGLGIVEGLEALLEKEANPGTRGALGRLLEGLREGKRFSAVLADQADLFPPLYIGIVRAAEGTSDLPRALSRYIDYQQRIDLVRAKIVSAAIYPVILLLVGGGVSTFLITYVVPRFAEVYQGAGRSLPWMSQLLLSWGQFASNHTAMLLGGIATVIALGTLLVRRITANGGAIRLVAKVPGIGERVRIYELSRLYLTLGMLSEGGITIVQAITTVQDMVSPGMRSSLQAARLSIEAGLPLSTSFEVNDLTTPISLRMLRVGERTGDMGPMLSQSAAFYDGEISRWIERFTRTFEPLLMAAIGLVVGAIVVLLYMPIFDLAGDIS